MAKGKVPTRDELLAFIRDSETPVGKREIAKAYGLKGDQRIELKELLRDLLPVRKDIDDAIAVMRYNLGFATEKPRFSRFSYIEKSEYWALIWGTFVMGVTGVILWADNVFLGILTKLWWDVARTVHYYEAWLATLSIIVWHFYFVIFNPDTYPINLAFWKGTLTEEEMEEEHPLELEKLRAAMDSSAAGSDHA